MGALVAVASGAVSALVGSLIGQFLTDYVGLLIFVSFLVGYGMGEVIVEILDASVLTLLMSVCIDPSSLGDRAPWLREYLNRHYSTACDGLLSSAA